MILLDLLIYISLIVLGYGIAQKIYGALNKDILEARSLASVHTTKQRVDFNKNFYKSITENKNLKTHFQKLEDFLSYCGEPFNFKLTPLRFYAIKFGLSIASLLLLIYSHALNFFTILIPVFFFFLVDLCCLYQFKEDRKKVIKEMPNIYNVLEIQSYGDIPFEKSILSLQDVVHFKRLKDAFAEMSAEILMNKDIKEALRNFEKKFRMPEIYNFTLTIDQGLETGKICEMLTNQRKILYKTYLCSKDSETDKNELKITLCLLLLLISGSAVTVYGFFFKISQQVQNMFNF